MGTGTRQTNRTQRRRDDSPEHARCWTPDLSTQQCHWQPQPQAHVDSDTALEAGPDTAAAYAWHATDTEQSLLTQVIVDHAATHHDAHLAKYTVAAYHAARLDPDAAHLFGAASAYLAAWWHHHDNNPS